MIKVKSNTVLQNHNTNINDFYNIEQYELGKKISRITKQDVHQLLINYPLINEIFNKNEQKNKKKLLDYFIRQPSKSDCSGFIYGFMNQNQNNLLSTPYWIKIGRTKDDCPQKRIYQWEKQQDCQFTEIFTIRSLYNRKLQLLVHTLFAYARERRIIKGKKRLQWFKFQQITLTAAAVNILNHIMNIIHQKCLSYKQKKAQISLDIKIKEVTNKIATFNTKMRQVAKISGQKIAESLAKQLSQQIGPNEQIKKKLVKCNSIHDIIQTTQQYDFGKQLKQYSQQIYQAQKVINKYTCFLKEFQQFIINNIQQIKDNSFVVALKSKQIKNKDDDQKIINAAYKTKCKIGENAIKQNVDNNENIKTLKKKDTKKNKQQQKTKQNNLTQQKNKNNNNKKQDQQQKQISQVKQVGLKQQKTKNNKKKKQQQQTKSAKQDNLTQQKKNNKKKKQQQQTKSAKQDNLTQQKKNNKKKKQQQQKQKKLIKQDNFTQKEFFASIIKLDESQLFYTVSTEQVKFFQQHENNIIKQSQKQIDPLEKYCIKQKVIKVTKNLTSQDPIIQTN